MTQKKLYYNKIFENCKNNIKDTWNVINQALNRCNTTEIPFYLLKNTNTKVENLQIMVEEFNNYFVNIGPSLAQKNPCAG